MEVVNALLTPTQVEIRLTFQVLLYITKLTPKAIFFYYFDKIFICLITFVMELTPLFNVLIVLVLFLYLI